MPRGFPDWKEFAPQKSLEQLLREGHGFGGRTWKTGFAGNLSLCQLWNPANSGIAIYVYGVNTSTSAAGIFYGSLSSTALSALDGSGINRHAGEGSSIGELRGEYRAANFGDAVFWEYVAAGKWINVQPVYIWLPEGHGLHVSVPSWAVTVDTAWFWFEFGEW